MRIEQSTVALASSRYASTTDEQRVAVRAWIGSRPAVDPSRPTERSVSVTISAAAAALLAHPDTGPDQASTSRADGAATTDDIVNADPRLRTLIALIERLTGHKVRLMRVALGPMVQADPLPASVSGPQPAAAARPPAGDPGWGAEVEMKQTHTEVEQTAFVAQGTAETADGQTIAFQLDLDMHRSVTEESSSDILLGNARRVDPLALSLDGGPVSLADDRFAFDLNSDGTAEAVARPGGNTAFLALDRNGNGTIDDGSELFGPATGSGFSELAAYDADRNGWIDEADPVFGRLSLWTAGREPGRTLADAGVGAIFLGSAATQFDLRGTAGEDLGRITDSSVYLSEDGHAAAVQQIDLTA